ncbi:hypothetical protein ACFX12_012947 [Malus domestica]
MPTEGSPNLGLGFELIDLFSDFLLARLSLRVGILGGLPGLAFENSGEGELTGTDLENPLLDSADALAGEPTLLCLGAEYSEPLEGDPFAALFSSLRTSSTTSPPLKKTSPTCLLPRLSKAFLSL